MESVGTVKSKSLLQTVQVQPTSHAGNKKYTLNFSEGNFLGIWSFEKQGIRSRNKREVSRKSR
jgi:hypothetical protein